MTAVWILALVGAALIGAGVWLYTPDRPRARLEAGYATPPSTFMAVAGLRLHVRDTGPRTGPAIVMLHGFGSSLHTWERWADALSDRWRVVRFDLPGFGLTGPDPTGDYSDTRSLQVLAALMDALAIARAGLIGSSMGGKLAWMFAAEHPERVDRLVLVSPDGFAGPGFAYGKKIRVPLFLRLLPVVSPRSMMRKVLARTFADPAVLTDDLLQRYWDMMLVPGNRGAMLARLQQIELQPPEPSLARISAPTLLIWGEQDAMIPVGNASAFAAALHDVRVVTLPHVGHVPQEEAPDRALRPIRAFLDH